MMVVIVDVIVLKMKPNSVNLLAIVSALEQREMHTELQNNFDVYSRSYQESKR